MINEPNNHYTVPPLYIFMIFAIIFLGKYLFSLFIRRLGSMKSHNGPPTTRSDSKDGLMHTRNDPKPQDDPLDTKQMKGLISLRVCDML